jgi:Amt family ammonium transporter
MVCAAYAIRIPRGIPVAMGRPAFRTPLMLCTYPEVYAVRRLLPALTVTAIMLSGVARADESLPIAKIKDTEQAQQAGDIAWMLVSTALVLFMVPGLALFYGGMVRRKNVLGTMMHSMIALSIVGLQWVLFGYSLAFGASKGGWIGWSPEFLGLGSEQLYDAVFPGTKIPIFIHCMYQGMFAIITPALISGAFAERVRFGPYCLFITLWATLVYDPLAHWVWAIGADGKPAGWLGQMGALDFAGGTVVHVAAGFAGLAAILCLRKRIGYPQHAMHPNSMVLTLTGAGLLWFGWFGFNGGSALAASPLAGNALTASQVAAAAAGLSWVFVEWLHRGKPTGLGLASGIVAGLVAVTPASGFVAPPGALVIGLLAGGVCYGAVCLKPKLKYDDSLDAFGVHGIGGFLGAILTGVFAVELLWQKGSGTTDALGKLASDGRAVQVWVQFVAASSAAVFSFVGTVILVKLIDLTIGFALPAKAEAVGLDQSMHGETGFDLNPVEEMPMGDFAPRPASVPPEGKRRFTVVVEGPKNGDLVHAWSQLCQPGKEPPPADFSAVYPYVTTVQGNRFRFRGGDPSQLRESLERLFRDRLDGASVKTYVEN